jgi:hypothetical protein
MKVVSFAPQPLRPEETPKVPTYYGKRYSLLQEVQTGFGAHPVSVQWVAVALSLGVKRPGRDADHSSPSGAEKNLFPTWDETSQLEYDESVVSAGRCHSPYGTILNEHPTCWIPRATSLSVWWHSAALQFTGFYCSRLFYGGIWKLKFLLTPSLTLTALKMQFVRRLRMLRRTLYVASWQVYLGDGSNAFIAMQDISKTLYWRREAFLWIQDTDLLNCVQLYLLLCTINVLSYFQNG